MKTKNKFYKIAEFKSLDVFIEAIAFIGSILLFMLNNCNWSYFVIFPIVQILSAVIWLLHSGKEAGQVKSAITLRAGLICYDAFIGFIILVIVWYPSFILILGPISIGLFALACIGCVLYSGLYFDLVIDEMNFYVALSKSARIIPYNKH